MSKLVLFLADGTTLDVPLKRERMTIGRRADNDICLPNLAVSGEHAAVVTILADSFLEDLGSTNGTLVNGAPISKHFLREGDQVDIGRHVLIFCVDDDTVLAPDVVRSSVRSAVGDLGERVEAAKPFVKARGGAAAGGSVMRRDRVAENAAALREVGSEAEPGSDQVPDPVPAAEATSQNLARPASSPVSIKVLSGPGAGRAIPLTKASTTLGRAGVQVALISRTGDSFSLSLIEGERPPLLNGTVPTGDETPLASGDIIEILGARLEFVAPALVVDRS
jgi:pSer/pThr/pTyr-binding forkhead associated (FHA) protein